MALILRVDIDKPYGHHNMIKKILSKVREDYFFPAIDNFGYLKPTISFLQFCNAHKIPALLYFRNCTVPNDAVKKLIKEGNYLVGFHAENTRSMQTFSQELEIFQKALPQRVVSFTKHGSGKLKLGKNHYPPFEPDKYKEWSKQLNLEFSLGNGNTNQLSELYAKGSYYPNMFWLEHAYRVSPLDSVEPIVEAAKEKNIALVIHPANFFTYTEVKNDLEKMVHLARKLNVQWLNHVEF